MGKCEICGKSAYPAESYTVNSRDFHKSCFQCSHCKIKLNMSSFVLQKPSQVISCKQCDSVTKLRPHQGADLSMTTAASNPKVSQFNSHAGVAPGTITTSDAMTAHAMNQNRAAPRAFNPHAGVAAGTVTTGDVLLAHGVRQQAPRVFNPHAGVAAGTVTTQDVLLSHNISNSQNNVRLFNPHSGQGAGSSVVDVQMAHAMNVPRADLARAQERHAPN
jgi:hypothetical protein